jgi:hypothetical protein
MSSVPLYPTLEVLDENWAIIRIGEASYFQNLHNYAQRVNSRVSSQNTMWLLDSRVNELPTVVAHVIAENDKILVGRDNILKEQYLPKDTLPFVYWVNSISESTFLIST